MSRVLSATLVASLAAHAFAAVSLGRVERPAPSAAPPSTLAFDVSRPPSPPPPPPSTPPPPSAPTAPPSPRTESRPRTAAPRTVARRAPQPMVANASAPDVIAVPAPSETIADALPVAAPPAPDAPPAPAPPSPAVVSVAPPRPPPPRVVALADLSARPVSPRLDEVLARNYPAWARAQGRRGEASVRFRIDADGVVREATVKRESEAGFGDACRATVLGSRWSPPRDRGGVAVATTASYTCRFEVQ